MTEDRNTRIEKSQYKYINNCCKSILVTLRIMQQCNYLNKDMIDTFATWIDFDIDTIQENCIDLIEDDEEQTE